MKTFLLLSFFSMTYFSSVSSQCTDDAESCVSSQCTDDAESYPLSIRNPQLGEGREDGSEQSALEQYMRHISQLMCYMFEQISDIKVKTGLSPKPFPPYFYSFTTPERESIARLRLNYFIHNLKGKINDYLGGIKVAQSGLLETSEAAVPTQQEEVERVLDVLSQVASKAPLVGQVGDVIKRGGLAVYSVIQDLTSEDPGEKPYENIQDTTSFFQVDALAYQIAHIVGHWYIDFIQAFDGDDRCVQRTLCHLAREVFHNVHYHIQRGTKSRKNFKISDVIDLMLTTSTKQRSVTQRLHSYLFQKKHIGTINGVNVGLFDVMLGPVSVWNKETKKWHICSYIPEQAKAPTGCCLAPSKVATQGLFSARPLFLSDGTLITRRLSYERAIRNRWHASSVGSE